MSRPKSAGSGTHSFLDDLLGINNKQISQTSVSSSARQRKSVRFFDEGSEDQQQQYEIKSRSSPRPHTSTLDSLLDTKSIAQSSRLNGSSNKSSKSDWLGIGGSDDNNDGHMDLSLKSSISEPLKHQQPISLSSVRPNSPLSSTTTTTIKTTVRPNDEPEWITAGLKARQSRQSIDLAKKPIFLQDKSPKENISDITMAAGAAASMINQQNKLSNRSWQSKLSEDSSIMGSSSATSSSLSGAKRVGPFDHLEQTTTLISERQEIQSKSIRELDTNLNETLIHKTIKQQQKDGNIEETSGQINLDESESDILPINKDSLNTSQQQQQSITVLQTKLRILTLEKSFLEQTVEQMKRNHHDELDAMISLHEQQMRLTSEMYKRHEDMIQEERDRRIVELKGQLDQTEKELETMRNKYKERLITIEEEYCLETKRLQDSYAATTKQMIDEHEQELKRLEQRLRSENESSIQTSTDLVKQQTKSVSELMAKWEESAFKIEKLQRSVIAKQEELAREQMLNNADDVLANKLNDIEDKWKSFIGDMQKQRSALEESIKIEHEKYFIKEETRIKEMQKKLDQDNKEFDILRENFATEVNEWRHKESIEAEKLYNEREKLKEEVALFEERRCLLETLYNERKKMLDDEQSRITKQSQEFIKKQSELSQKESIMMKSFLELEQQQQQWQSRKKRFDQEREQMAQLGQTLEKRAEELEKLSQMALKEKLDGISAMDEVERLRMEIRKESADIQNAQTQIQMDKQGLLIERNQLEQQFKFLKELKDTIVCNLCGNALNRVSQLPMLTNSKGLFSYNHQDSCSGVFYSLINGGYFMRQQNVYNADMANNNQNNPMSPWQSFRSMTDHDEDKTLFLWQMAAQQDAASLAEETKFLKIIMNNHLINKMNDQPCNK